jgi:DNA repair protein RadC
MPTLTADQLATIDTAIAILGGLYKKQDLFATSPDRAKQFCQLQAAHLEHEVFGVLLLDNQHQLIESVILFRGTIDGAAVYPREVVKEVLSVNANACIFFHNHPSSLAEPSDADRRITSRLIDALKLIDVRVLDHLIVTCNGAYSFAEAGLL